MHLRQVMRWLATTNTCSPHAGSVTVTSAPELPLGADVPS
jgi:hypothetical protein